MNLIISDKLWVGIGRLAVLIGVVSGLLGVVDMISKARADLLAKCVDFPFPSELVGSSRRTEVFLAVEAGARAVGVVDALERKQLTDAILTKYDSIASSIIDEIGARILTRCDVQNMGSCAGT